MPQTILVTGATGFIAKHIVAGLLNRGHYVVASARSADSAAAIRRAVTPVLDDATNLETRLRVVPLDLTSDVGWEDAMQGVDALMHTASPFPMVQPRDAQEVIRPAVDGALRALKAAQTAGVTRVILTSSTVSVATRDLPPGKAAFDEDDWSDNDHPTATPYSRSKTMAEQAAWDFVQKQAPTMQLTVINPGFVLGPPLDGQYGTSIKVIERVLSAKDPMLPRFGFSTVDVRDIAEMHIRALERPETVGERILGVSGFLWFSEMAKAVAEDHPARKISTREAPNVVVKLLSLFDPAIRSIVPALGKQQPVSNAKAKRLLGMEFRDPRAAAKASAAEAVKYM